MIGIDLNSGIYRNCCYGYLFLLELAGYIGLGIDSQFFWIYIGKIYSKIKCRSYKDESKFVIFS